MKDQLISKEQNLTEMAWRTMARRGFLRQMSAMTGAAVAGAMTGVGSTTTATAQTAQVPSATDITTVKAILNNEYMEAEFYLRIAYGTGLSAQDTSGAEMRRESSRALLNKPCFSPCSPPLPVSWVTKLTMADTFDSH